MMSLERHEQGERVGSYLAFLVRRVGRIYPLSILVVLVVVALQLPIGDTVAGHFVPAHVDRATVLSNLLLTQNLTHSDAVMAPLWTLPYEMQMYLVLPLLYWLARRSRGVWPLLGVWALSALTAKLVQNKPWGDLVAYVPCFTAGVVAYKLIGSGSARRWPFWGWLLVLAASTAICQWRYSLRNAWIYCLFIGLMIPQFRELQAGHLQRFCQIVARYSYGVYLTHYVCLWFAFDYLGGAPLLERWAVFIVSAVALPVLLYHGLEAPMVRASGRLADRLSRPRALPGTS
jgi:peptidoglycan/LPS O-acetylase OafA/YrhL